MNLVMAVTVTQGQVGGGVVVGVAVPAMRFDIIDPSSPMQVFLLAPSALQEIVLAVWLIVKGFNPFAIATLSAKIDMI